MITQELLTKLFYYDDIIGDLISKTTNKSASVKNGNGSDGKYKRVIINGVKYRLHILIWIYHNGPVAIGYIVDHQDRDRLNNRITNLRILTHRANRINSSISTRNKSGINGIHWDKVCSKWKVSIGYNGRDISIGRFSTLDDAACARLEAEYYFCNDKYIDMSSAKQYVIKNIQPNHI